MKNRKEKKNAKQTCSEQTKTRVKKKSGKKKAIEHNNIMCTQCERRDP